MIRYEINGKMILCLLATIAGFVVYQSFNLWRSPDGSLKNSQAAQLAQRLSLDLPPLDGRPKVAIAPFLRDEEEHLTELLRTWVGRRNLQVVRPTWTQATLDYVLPREASEPAVELQRAASYLGSGYVVCGEVLEWVTFPSSEARLRVRAQMLDVETGKTIYEKELSIPDRTSQTSAPLPRAIDSASAQVIEWTSDPFVMGVVVWLLVVIVTPWLFAGSVSRTLERESNTSNAVMLVVFTLLMALSAWLCWGRLLDPGSSWLVILIAVLVCVPYFGFVCGRIDDARR